MQAREARRGGKGAAEDWLESNRHLKYNLTIFPPSLFAFSLCAIPYTESEASIIGAAETRVESSRARAAENFDIAAMAKLSMETLLCSYSLYCKVHRRTRCCCCVSFFLVSKTSYQKVSFESSLLCIYFAAICYFMYIKCIQDYIFLIYGWFFLCNITICEC